MEFGNVKEPILVSACLIGIDCRYDGRNCFDKQLLEKLRNIVPVPFCPEIYGGLGIPRDTCEIKDGDGDSVLNNKSIIVSSAGKNITQQYINGSLAGLKICVIAGIKKAILKERSPACGVYKIYNNGTIREGSGVFAALLRRNNIEVFSSEEI